MHQTPSIPWQEFFDWLVKEISELEPLNYKSIPWSSCGWQRHFRARMLRAERNLIKQGVSLTGKPPMVRAIPSYLSQAKSEKAMKLFVAYVVATQLGLSTNRCDFLRKSLGKKGPEDNAALKMRVHEFRKKLKKLQVPESAVIEEQFAWFRFNIPGKPGAPREPYGKKPNEKLPPILPWDPTAGLSGFEKAEISRLCSNACLAARSPNPQGHAPYDGR